MFSSVGQCVGRLVPSIPALLNLKLLNFRNPTHNFNLTSSSKTRHSKQRTRNAQLAPGTSIIPTTTSNRSRTDNTQPHRATRIIHQPVYTSFNLNTNNKNVRPRRNIQLRHQRSYRAAQGNHFRCDRHRVCSFLLRSGNMPILSIGIRSQI